MIWFNQVAPGVIEMHGCAAPEYRGRWLTRSVLDNLWAMFNISKSHTMISQCADPYIKKVLRKAGFDIHNNIAIMKGVSPHGIPTKV